LELLVGPGIAANRIVFSILGVCLLLGAAPAAAAIWNYTAEPLPGDTYTIADFRIYVPDEAPLIRGVYFYVAPHLADSRSYAENPEFQALCADVDFAMMGARLDSRHMDTGIGDAVLRALAFFGGVSFHPEIEFSSLFFEGYSWGGQFAYHFTKWLPARVSGFVTQKGGYHDTSFAGDAILVPGYLFIGEFDLPYRITNLTGIFEEHRALGARWILAMQPGAAHEPITDRELLDDFFHTVITLRLPATYPPDEAAELLTIPEPGHWLGNRDTQLIGDWECYDAPRDSACWFVSRLVGQTWQSFVSAGAVTDTLPCSPTAVESRPTPAPVASMLPSRPNPFNPTTVLEYRISSAGPVRLTVHDAAGKRIATLTDGFHRAGRYATRWHGAADSGQPVASGVYFARLSANGSTTIHKMTLLQ